MSTECYVVVDTMYQMYLTPNGMWSYDFDKARLLNFKYEAEYVIFSNKLGTFEQIQIKRAVVTMEDC